MRHTPFPSTIPIDALVLGPLAAPAMRGAFLFLFFAACSVHVNRPISEAGLRSLEIDKTPQRDAVATLGQPLDRTEEVVDGVKFERLIYVHGQLDVLLQPRLELVLLEFRDGVLSGVLYSSDDRDALERFDRVERDVAQVQGKGFANLPDPDGEFHCPSLKHSCVSGERVLVWAQLRAKSVRFASLVVGEDGRVRDAQIR